MKVWMIDTQGKTGFRKLLIVSHYCKVLCPTKKFTNCSLNRKKFGTLKKYRVLTNAFMIFFFAQQVYDHFGFGSMGSSINPVPTQGGRGGTMKVGHMCYKV